MKETVRNEGTENQEFLTGKALKVRKKHMKHEVSHLRPTLSSKLSAKLGFRFSLSGT